MSVSSIGNGDSPHDAIGQLAELLDRGDVTGVVVLAVAGDGYEAFGCGEVTNERLVAMAMWAMHFGVHEIDGGG